MTILARYSRQHFVVSLIHISGVLVGLLVVERMHHVYAGISWYETLHVDLRKITLIFYDYVHVIW